MSSLFGSADTSELGRSMEQFMKAELLEAGSTAALHDHAFDERHKALYREYQRQFETDTKDAGCLLNPRVKRDHKSQYRMQCAVSKKDVDFDDWSRNPDRSRHLHGRLHGAASRRDEEGSTPLGDR
jgi:hypothetical protein